MLHGFFEICIDSNYHNKGLGKILLSESIRKLHSLNYELMGLSVTSNNKNAIRLYENHLFFKVDDFCEITTWDPNED